MRVVSHLAYSPPEPLLCPTSVSTTTAEPERRLRCLREKKVSFFFQGAKKSWSGNFLASK